MRTRSAARAAPGGTRTAAPGQGDTPPTVARRGESPDVPAARPAKHGIAPRFSSRFRDDSDTLDPRASVPAAVPAATPRASRMKRKPVRFRSPDASEPTRKRSPDASEPTRERATKKLRARASRAPDASRHPGSRAGLRTSLSAVISLEGRSHESRTSLHESLGPGSPGDGAAPIEAASTAQAAARRAVPLRSGVADVAGGHGIRSSSRSGPDYDSARQSRDEARPLGSTRCASLPSSPAARARRSYYYCVQ